MKKIIYLTTNIHKVEEANRHFVKKYGFNVEIKNPDFEVLEIQSKSCIDVAKFSAKYAAEKLKCGVLKSDSGVYIDYLGGLPGPYNAYFDKQIGVDKFLKMLEHVTLPQERSCRLEHVFAYCEPGEEPIAFAGGTMGRVSFEARGTRGRWHDLWFIPDGETKTLSQLREEDEMNEAKFWGTAIDDFAEWFLNRIL
jgi:XTP/dITP diphosphohydrolase